MKLKAQATLISILSLSIGLVGAAPKEAEATTYQACAAGFVSIDSGANCEKTFTSTIPTTFTAPSGVTSVDVLLVGGGGGSGGTMGGAIEIASGGGGGGEVKVIKNVSVSSSAAVTVIVGAGGTVQNVEPRDGLDGGPTSFGAYSAAGGLGSGGTGANLGKGGASGNGNAGGIANFVDTLHFTSGGGGGAGAAGQDGIGTLGSIAFRGGNGGDGLQPSSLNAAAGLFVTDTNYYGGGGAGGGWNGSNVIVQGTGGLGGGGSQYGSFPFGDQGAANTGGGAGGMDQGGYSGYYGGSGVVKVRYAALPVLTSTSVALTLSPGQWLEAGDAVGISAEITASSGTVDPTGTVSWSYCYAAYDAVSYPSCNLSNDTPLAGHSSDTLVAQTPFDGKAKSIIASLSLPSPSGKYMFIAEYLGDSNYSGEWNSASLLLDLVAPGSPGTPTGTAGDGGVDLSWTAPSTGTAPFTYTVTSSPAGASCSVTGTTATCTGLTNGTAYTFKVTASNDAGSQDSSFSSPITPEAAGSGGGSSGSSKAKYKPVKPSESEVSVFPGKGSLRFGLNYSGSNAYKPSSYTVSVSPSGNSCVAYGSSSSCEIIGLKAGVEYTVSIQASNGLGKSSVLVLTKKYILGENGLLKFQAKKSLINFAGDSAKLTTAFKSTIRTFLTQNAGLSAITCTGYTAGKPVLKSDKTLAIARAKAVCGYIKKVQPTLITTTVGKTPGLAWGPKNRKVVMRGYTESSN